MATPFFKSSEAAVAFGVHANFDQVRILKALRNLYLQAAKSFPTGASIEELETALFFATQAQFMREALESVKA